MSTVSKHTSVDGSPLSAQQALAGMLYAVIAMACFAVLDTTNKFLLAANREQFEASNCSRFAATDIKFFGFW